MSVVLDASMAITWLFDDEQTEAADAVLKRVIRDAYYAEGVSQGCKGQLTSFAVSWATAASAGSPRP